MIDIGQKINIDDIPAEDYRWFYEGSLFNMVSAERIKSDILTEVQKHFRGNYYWRHPIARVTANGFTLTLFDKDSSRLKPAQYKAHLGKVSKMLKIWMKSQNANTK